MLRVWLQSAARATTCHASLYATQARHAVSAAPAAAEPAAASPPGPTSADAAHYSSIPGATACSVAIVEVAPGLRGLRATRHIQQYEPLLSLPRTHVLAVWDSLHLKARLRSWCKYMVAFQQKWQVKLPRPLLEVLSDTETFGKHLRMAVLLLWVRRHVAAPFWQQWVQQLPPLEQHTSAGPAWSPAAIHQLQWPYLQEHMMDASSIKVHIVEALVQLLKSPRLKQLDLTRGGRANKLAHWAVQTVSTRVHEDRAGRTLLVPYEDMANHSSAAVAGFYTNPTRVVLIAVDSIAEGQEVTLRYHNDSPNDATMRIWGFVERGNPHDWPYPIQRPLQALPRLPWDVVLAAAGRLHDLVLLGPQGLLQQLQQQHSPPPRPPPPPPPQQQQQQQQQGLSLSPGDWASLTEGQPVNRILAAASSLPLEADTTLDSCDPLQPGNILQFKERMELLRNQGQGPLAGASWLDMPADEQEPLWQQPARLHIMQVVRDSLGARTNQPAPPAATAAALVAAAAAVAKPDNQKQRWEATLAALTARLLGLHARLGLLTVPTTLEEDVAIEGAALAGGFAGWTPWRVAQLLGWHEASASVYVHAQQQAHAQALEALQHELFEHTRDVAHLQWEQHTSSSSRAKRKRLQERLAELEGRVQALTQKVARSARRRVRIARLLQLAQHGDDGTAAAGAGINACLLKAIQARLQQKMLIHVYGLLCEAVAEELQRRAA